MGLSNNKKKNNLLKIGSKNFDKENWSVFHPNGKHMFTTNSKKKDWYINKGLATIIDDWKIKLNFIPNGEGFEDNEMFGKSIRKSICVVDGKDYELQRHHIVPYCYRSHFPEEFKSRNHHDVVLINHDNHCDYEIIASGFKDEIAEMFNIKTIIEYNSEYSRLLREYYREKSIVLNNLKALFLGYGKINDEKKTFLLNNISELLDLPSDFIFELTYIQLYKLYVELYKIYSDELDEFKKDNKLKYDHGYQVVKNLNTEDKLRNFVTLWRTHFIDTMNPQYMPDGWSINFRIKTNL